MNLVAKVKHYRLQSLEFSGYPRISEGTRPHPLRPSSMRDRVSLGPRGKAASSRRWFASPPEHGGTFAEGDAGGSGGLAIGLASVKSRKRRGNSAQNASGFQRQQRARQYKDKWPGALADHREGSPRRGPAHGRCAGATQRCFEGVQVEPASAELPASHALFSESAEHFESGRSRERARCAQ